MIRVFAGCYPHTAAGVMRYSPTQYRSRKDILLLRKKQSESIGIPKLPTMPQFYGEYYLPVAQRVVVASGFFSELTDTKTFRSETTCGPVFGSFDAQPGHDYVINALKRRSCALSVSELITSDDGTVTQHPVVISTEAPGCD